MEIFARLKKLASAPRHLVSAAIVGLLTITSAVAMAEPKPKYFVDMEQLADIEKLPAIDGVTQYSGVHANAGYWIEVPANWNGELVVWAHGFRGTDLELTVEAPPEGLREVILEEEFAWAASSYDRNDYDISSGVKSSHALIGKFSGLVGEPSRIYMAGASMGGHITAVAIEQYRNLFAGALAVCGVMGDYALFDYFLDFNLAAQQLGTGSSEFPIDPFVYFPTTVPAIKSSLEAFPGAWPFFLNAQGEQLKSLTEIQSGGVRPNFDNAWDFWNGLVPTETGSGFLFELALGDGSLPRAPGSAVDNAETVYQFDADEVQDVQDLNDHIFRIAAEPQTRRKQGLAQVPTISGDINVPVLTMHNLGDLFVPVLNQVEYQERVSANGNSDLLVQRAIRGVGHCGFTSEEFRVAFLDLKNWVEEDEKPVGDDFSDPESIADPDFGCQFTDFETEDGHILATACE